MPCMNYVIMCPPRSGSTYLGELFALHGIPYCNELFTPEICRRRNIWPHDLDEQLNSHVIDLAFSNPRSGFKFPYNFAQPGIYADLANRKAVNVIHIIRDDLLEQYASWQFLNVHGISLAMATGEIYGTDGKQRDLPSDLRFSADPVNAVEHFRKMEQFREMVHFLFATTHRYMLIPFGDLFTTEGQDRALRFLGVIRNENSVPNHTPTPRPRASDLFENYADLCGALRNAGFAKYL